MTQNWKTPKIKRLSKALASVTDEKDMLLLVRDLCTLEEITEMANRWEAVQMIEKGNPYREIAEKTGMSTTTITRIAHWLKHGEGGYAKALSKRKK
ncbi:DNA-binding transcriptional regulator [Candidatus Parcubacteria bacterium]|jgi:TrpR-related protein YerC/YecD|nr:DNA-binding transcriptional regulator [Candidatus Parcubacteria bacterium]MBT3948654.1 DNA-binding transcriptional regulator [Candidatus Parcubacteria bacterium]